MNVLKRCVLRSLKENRKRTTVTVIGVILAAALITGVACLAESMRESLIAYEKAKGDYHYSFSGVSGEDLKYFENNNNVERFGLVGEIGYAPLEGSDNPDKPYLYIRAADEEGLRSMALKLTEGRMPEKDDELVIGAHIRYNGMVDLQVGDTLTLEVGHRVSGCLALNQSNPYSYEEEHLHPVTEKTYTIVGVVERPSLIVESRYAPGYSVFTCLGTGDEGALAQTSQYEVYATYTKQGLQNADQVTAGLLGVSEELYRHYYRGDGGGLTQEEYAAVTAKASNVSENYWLIKWQVMRFTPGRSLGIMSVMYSMAALALLVIIVTGVFCIRNSFVISLTEKMKLYGRLSSVGSTSGQQRKMVYYEALFIGSIGIPLGIVSGVLASVILVRLVSGLVEEAVDIPFVFGVSYPAILLAVVLSGITILLSAMQSARRAGKISPINAIRANDSFKINRRELKCPAFIGKVFGIGGRIAYRNLRRARRRYRTTVISIVVSVAVFIGLTTFVDLLRIATGIYYKDLPYQLHIYVGDMDQDGLENAKKISQISGVQRVEILREVYADSDTKDLPLTEEYLELFFPDIQPGEKAYDLVYICALGDTGYADYCESLGVTVEEAKDRAIAVALWSTTRHEDGKIYQDSGRVAEFHSGDRVSVTCEDIETGETVEETLNVLLQTDTKPMSLWNYNMNAVVLVISDSWLDNSALSPMVRKNVAVNIKCKNADQVEQTIRGEFSLGAMTVSNYEASHQSERSMYLVVSIFLYGFITVVALIGITNVFNTITTNLELRAPEFAMLRAVGMTGREFRRMIWLEGFFYSGKALLIGIPAGIVISVAFHMIFSEGVVTQYRVPYFGIGLSAAAVTLLLYGIMHYSMGKINRKNIVETIRNENL